MPYHAELVKLYLLDDDKKNALKRKKKLFNQFYFR